MGCGFREAWKLVRWCELSGLADETVAFFQFHRIPVTKPKE
jgi:hypothetical protein